ncbi:unnamed protein product [Diamesa serratosioi]
MFNRIQKLIENEYVNFNDDVLVESPFAQVANFQGKGLRAVQIALTVDSLIIASDQFLFRGDIDVTQFHKLDPETESLELCQIIPLQFVRIKFIRVGLTDKLFMEVQCKNNQKKVWRFEFGGHFFKYFFWNVWMDKMKRLQEEQLGVISKEKDDQQVLNVFNGSVYEWSDSERSVETSDIESLSSMKESLKHSILKDTSEKMVECKSFLKIPIESKSKSLSSKLFKSMSRIPTKNCSVTSTKSEEGEKKINLLKNEETAV